MTQTSISTNCLSEITFIAGTYKELVFDVYDNGGRAINMGAFTCEWYMSPFGQPSVISASANGVYQSDNRFIVYLDSTVTSGLSGKYVHQPVIIGNPGYEYRPAQGHINIVPAIGA